MAGHGARNRGRSAHWARARIAPWSVPAPFPARRWPRPQSGRGASGEKSWKSLPAVVVLPEGDRAPADLSTGRRTLHIHPQHEDRLGGGHEDMVALGPGKAEIGARLRQADAADQLAVRIPHRDPGI